MIILILIYCILTTLIIISLVSFLIVIYYDILNLNCIRLHIYRDTQGGKTCLKRN